MRARLRLAGGTLLLALFALFGATACENAAEESAFKASAITSTCSWTLTRAGPKFLVVAANSTDNNASWFIKNTGTVGISINSESRSFTPNVTATYPGGWAPLPYTLAPGSQIDADLRFDVGATDSGTDQVTLTINTSCGSKNSSYLVTIN